MEKCNKCKIAGRSQVMVDRVTQRYSIRYDTTIYYNPTDSGFLNKLIYLECDIISVMGKYIRLILPVGWMHVRTQMEEFIMDERGRKRIDINTKERTSKLLRRFDFSITMITTGEDGEKSALISHILDAGQIIQTYPVTDELTKQFADEVGDTNKELLFNAFTEGIGEMISDIRPEWLNELAYWDE